jgi:hypothetical protein
LKHRLIPTLTRIAVVLAAAVLLSAPGGGRPAGKPAGRPSIEPYRPTTEAPKPKHGPEVRDPSKPPEPYKPPERPVEEPRVEEVLSKSTEGRAERLSNYDWIEVKLTDAKYAAKFDEILKTRAEDKIRSYEQVPFEKGQLVVVSLFTDTDTVEAVRSGVLRPYARESLQEVEPLFQGLTGQGKILAILGHVENGEFVQQGPSATRYSITELDRLAREHGVFFLALGCESAASSTLGSAHSFNSLDAVERLTRALEATTVAGFLQVIASADLVLRFDSTKLWDVSVFEVTERQSGEVVGVVYTGGFPSSPSSSSLSPQEPREEHPSYSNFEEEREREEDGTRLIVVISWLTGALLVLIPLGMILSGKGRALIDFLAELGADFAKDEHNEGGCGCVGTILLVGAGMYLLDEVHPILGVSVLLGSVVFLLSSTWLLERMADLRWPSALFGAVGCLGLVALALAILAAFLS